MARSFNYALLAVTVLLCAGLMPAQTRLDLNIGFGAIQDTANATQIDQALLPCTGPGDPNGPCVSTPSLSGFMLGFGADVMLWKRFGVGGNVTLQPAQQTYADLSAQAGFQGLNSFTLNSRMTLFDLDGVFEPVHAKKIGVKLRGGIGGANLKFYQNGSASNVIGSQDFSQYFASSNHFQVHGGLGVQAYITDHIFVRPEFTVHYVRNLNQQFGRNLVTEELVWLGYSWGGQ